MLVLMAIFCLTMIAARGAEYTNPTVNAQTPDPGVFFDSPSGLYVSTTTSDTSPSDPGYPFPLFPIRVSKDLVNWNFVGHIFPQNNSDSPKWAASDFWAPEIHVVDGRYFVYFVARDFTEFLCVGVATAPGPFGPWKDVGKPLVRNASTESLDPTIALNVQTGKYFVYWKQDDNLPDWKFWVPTKIFARELAPNMTSVADNSSPIFLFQNDLPWEGRVVEAPWMVYRPPFYFLFYSANDCCTVNSDYAVGVARSKSAIGPFEKKQTPVLQSSTAFIGPGHCSVIPLQASPNRSFMIYHSWLSGKVGKDSDNRTLMLDEVFWDESAQWPFMVNDEPSNTPQPIPPASG